MWRSKKKPAACTTDRVCQTEVKDGVWPSLMSEWCGPGDEKAPGIADLGELMAGAERRFGAGRNLKLFQKKER